MSRPFVRQHYVVDLNIPMRRNVSPGWRTEGSDELAAHPAGQSEAAPQTLPHLSGHAIPMRDAARRHKPERDRRPPSCRPSRAGPRNAGKTSSLACQWRTRPECRINSRVPWSGRRPPKGSRPVDLRAQSKTRPFFPEGRTYGQQPQGFQIRRQGDTLRAGFSLLQAHRPARVFPKLAELRSWLVFTPTDPAPSATRGSTVRRKWGRGG